MCGIICEILYSGYNKIDDDKVLQRIKNRGPDCNHAVEIDIGNGGSIFFYGAVLWMQGLQLTPQPVENNSGVLLYNGDNFDETWNSNAGDTQMIMNKLSESVNDSSDQQIIKQLKLLKGPFCLIYYNKLTNDLFFTRDRLGRSSMLFHRNEHSIIISSVLGRKYKCVEIPTTNIYKLNICTNKIKLYSWTNGAVTEYILQDWLKLLQIQQSLPDNEFTFPFESLVLNDEDNVIRYIETNVQETKCKLTLMRKLLDNNIINDIIGKITNLLERSVKIRVEKQTNKCKDCHQNRLQNCNHSAVGILFSGGLDCTILAFLANKYVPKEQSIDLINVAFKKGNTTSYDVPDRLTGRQSLKELKKLCQSRKWIFREINIPKEELEEFRPVIGDLVYPRQTILDESLGSVLWFAARGQNDNSISPCRILLLGSGADELFGGYTRHRKAFKYHGWSGLHKELQLDWKRISFRNLARDNRVICDHGRQPRMPYLDENFTDYVFKLKPWLKCFPSDNLGLGLGDKLMLRLVALNLGLTDVVTLPKRAMQFGTKIANKKDKGSDISQTFIDVNNR